MERARLTAEEVLREEFKVHQGRSNGEVIGQEDGGPEQRVGQDIGQAGGLFNVDFDFFI